MRRTSSDIIDELLVLGAQAGRRDDLARLIERWDPRLRRYATHLLGDPERAADATQDAWVRIVRTIRSLRDPARFGPWARRVVTNTCRDRGRRDRRDRRLHASGADPHTAAARGSGAAASGDAIGERAESAARLRAALRGMPPEARALLSLRYTDRLGLAEIARIVGVPVGTVKSRLHAARAELRLAIEPAAGERERPDTRRPDATSPADGAPTHQRPSTL